MYRVRSTLVVLCCRRSNGKFIYFRVWFHNLLAAWPPTTRDPRLATYLSLQEYKTDTVRYEPYET